MKIALISPKGPLYRHRGGIFGKSLRYQPLTLTTLAALIPEELNPSVEIYDEGVEDVPENLQADLVGITVITGNANRAYSLTDSLRMRGIPVVLGGPHPTLIPEEAMQHADSVCTGYAEDTWPELLRDFANGKMKPLYTQAPDLDLARSSMPYPRRDLMSPRNYLTQAVFEASRSCVHNCDFCVAPTAWGRKQYKKNIDWIVGDIKNVGVKRILFVDLNLISDIDYATELFNALIPLKVEWFGLTTVMIAHKPELMELMARSGCRGLLLGMETLSSESLGDAHKQFNASVDYSKLVRDLHALNISIQGCFVFGLDHDTVDSFDAAADYAIDLGIDLPRFAILTPFPNTPLYKRMASEGRILTRNWELYDGQHVVFQPRNMTPEELLRGHEHAWKKVYGWQNMTKRLYHAGNFSFLKLSANLGYRFYAHRLHRFYTCGIN